MAHRFPSHARAWVVVWVDVYEDPEGITIGRSGVIKRHHPKPANVFDSERHLRLAWRHTICGALVIPPDKLPSALPPVKCPSCGNDEGFDVLDRAWFARGKERRR